MNSRLQSFFKESLLSLQSLLYPPLCFSCQESVDHPTHDLCFGCSQSIELIETQNRCQTCFSIIKSQIMKESFENQETFIEQLQCIECQIGRSSYCLPLKSATLFSKQTLINHLFLNIPKHPPLAKTLAAYFVVQLDKLNWHTIDLITAEPLGRFDFLFDRPLIPLAQSIGSYLNIPFIKLYKQFRGDIFDYPQQLKTDFEKKQKSFCRLRHTKKMKQKHLLIISQFLPSLKERQKLTIQLMKMDVLSVSLLALFDPY